jgi:hypothetical protein
VSYHSAVVVLGCAVAVLLAVLVAIAAAVFARRDRATYPAACSKAASAFGTALTLVCSVTTALVAVTR